MRVSGCASDSMTFFQGGKRLPETSCSLSVVSPAPQLQSICLYNAIIGISAASPGLLRAGSSSLLFKMSGANGCHRTAFLEGVCPQL